MDKPTYNEEEYRSAVNQWKKAREKADTVMDKMNLQPGDEIYTLTEDDVKIINASRAAWDKVIEIARRS